MLLALILAASSPTNTVGRFDRTNSRTPQGRSCRGLPGAKCFSCVCANSTNYALQSQNMSNAAWVAAGGAVVTPSDGSPTYLAPDGTNTAQLLTVAACPAVSSIIYQLQNIPTGTASGSVWIRGAGSISVSVYDATGAAGQSVPCTASQDWTLCQVQKSTFNPTYIVFGCNIDPGYVGASNTGAASLYVWQGQLEISASATCPILTTAAPVTRTGGCSAVCQ